MATITPSVLSGTNNGIPVGTYVVTWGPMANGDVGSPFLCCNFPDKSVEVSGTFGAGGTVTFQGTNMVTSPTYSTLRDATGATLSITATDLRSILENPLQVRPNITAGDGTTSLTVSLVCTTIARR